MCKFIFVVLFTVGFITCKQVGAKNDMPFNCSASIDTFKLHAHFSYNIESIRWELEKQNKEGSRLSTIDGS